VAPILINLDINAQLRNHVFCSRASQAPVCTSLDRLDHEPGPGWVYQTHVQSTTIRHTTSSYGSTTICVQRSIVASLVGTTSLWGDWYYSIGGRRSRGGAAALCVAGVVRIANQDEGEFALRMSVLYCTCSSHVDIGIKFPPPPPPSSISPTTSMTNN
jgi:hypothetical protein